MNSTPLNVLLADDDIDDCFLFREALEELSVPTTLTTVNDGVQLMEMLSALATLPNVLFLDLNMPFKGGYECMEEIKTSPKLIDLPVVIYSTSLNMEVVEMLYQKGAAHYICKPGEFERLKNMIFEVVWRAVQHKLIQPERDKFIIQP